MLDKWEITIPQLTGEETRYAYCYVPDWAQQEDRFPVLYMFDGHNLFLDEEATYGKSWGMLEFLEENEIPLIVAAIECNHHPESDECGGRLSEYSPFDFKSRWWGTVKGRGKITMDYFVNEFKPYIDENYPTLPEREYTFISGSSMGGLMTIYALMEYNHVFSRGAALSPAISFEAKQVFELIDNAQLQPSVLYMDAGENELRKNSRKLFARTAAKLINKGVMVESRIIPDGNHSEETWEKQIPFFIDALFYDL
ncbi:MAG: alpha/beta hydrolase [Erysipelotrichaceae bacterium]|nr:alpha/beta hydrolase [Erysipelotrichaceae bacterium]